jgi:hypothetical protein
MSKPHLSNTQLEMYAKCPEQYRRRYIEGDVCPPGIALLKGGSFHKGAEVNMRQKIESHADLPVNELVEIAVADFDTRTNDAYVLSDDEQSRGAPVVIGEAKDDLAALVTAHAQQQAPDYQPVLVEQSIKIELPGPRDLVGVIDLADDQRRVIDFKTASRKKNQTDADQSLQLTIYSAAYQAETGEKPSDLRLDVVVAGSKGVSRQVLSTDRTDADLTVLANRIDAVSHAIAAGAFPPASPGVWWCSTRFCGFARSCPYFNSERQASNGD